MKKKTVAEVREQIEDKINKALWEVGIQIVNKDGYNPQKVRIKVLREIIFK